MPNRYLPLPLPLLAALALLAAGAASSRAPGKPVVDVRRAGGGPVDNCPLPIDPVPLPSNGSLPEDIQLALEDIDDFFETVLTNPELSEAERKTLAFSSCITLNDRVLKCSQFNGSGIARPSADTIFRIGSVTKTFVALAAFQLAERGLLSLDDPIVKYLPRFSIQNPWSFVQGPITVRQALSFLSGLPRSTPCAFGCNVTAGEMFARIASLSLGLPQWQIPRYSNLGISLVGYVVEAVSGVPYDQYIEDNILSVLNMTSTGFALTPEVRARLITGFNDASPGLPVEPVEMGWDAPSGGMYSTAEDLAKYVIALNSPPTKQSLFLYDSTLSEFLLATFPNQDASTAFGMTWLSLLFTDGARLISKSGSVPGFMSEVTIVQGRNLGLVTLYNYFSNAISTTVNNIQAVGMILPSIDSFYLNNVPQAPVVLEASLLVGNYTQKTGLAPSTVEILPLAGGPEGALGFSLGGTLQGYLKPSPSETRLGYLSLWLHYTVTGDVPCAATELSALDSMEILFFFPNSTTVTTAPSSNEALGLYLGDLWSQTPFLRS